MSTEHEQEHELIIAAKAQWRVRAKLRASAMEAAMRLAPAAEDLPTPVTDDDH